VLIVTIGDESKILDTIFPLLLSSVC
jgi:hypothetical protein